MKFTISAFATALFLVLPATTLAAVSLKDVEPISSSEVVQGCTTAYNAEIKNCSKDQFTSGTCTEACISDLQTHSTNVMLACRQAFAGPGTLLRKIIDGGLVVTLCPGGGSTTTKTGASASATGSPTGSPTGTVSKASGSATASVTGSATILPEPKDNDTTTGNETEGGNNTKGGDESGSSKSALPAGILFVAVIAGIVATL
ncbi:hypothetical protein DFH27DRAFT_117537 [Peziza echinospora]|nr:hypothetical protein DFH27DRAFT_117537 [Peziza echinospora]